MSSLTHASLINADKICATAKASSDITMVVRMHSQTSNFLQAYDSCQHHGQRTSSEKVQSLMDTNKGSPTWTDMELLQGQYCISRLLRHLIVLRNANPNALFCSLICPLFAIVTMVEGFKNMWYLLNLTEPISPIRRAMLSKTYAVFPFTMLFSKIHCVLPCNGFCCADGSAVRPFHPFEASSKLP